MGIGPISNGINTKKPKVSCDQTILYANVQAQIKKKVLLRKVKYEDQYETT
jgi:hypothetical protein